jgi:hypothetical protein
LINFYVGITNPWYTDNLRSLFCRAGRITKHKAWEFELTSYSYDIAKIDMSWTMRTDHAGLKLEFGLLGYMVTFNIYDIRHWDSKANSYESQ